MSAGLEGAAVVATDAIISIAIGLTKFAVFGVAGAVDAKVIAVAVLIGVVTFPGAFLAKALVARLPLHLHTALLDVGRDRRRRRDAHQRVRAVMMMHCDVMAGLSWPSTSWVTNLGHEREQDAGCPAQGRA